MTGENSTAAGASARDLKHVLGAMVFGANRPISLREMRKCLEAVGGRESGAAAAFAGARESDLRQALDELRGELDKAHCGFHLAEIAGGFRLQSDPACGAWLKQLLDIGHPQRLSRPALETLAIVAYRQPVTKGEIEKIRGVNVDYVIKVLMETQLVRISGRSELPGRPFLYGTTQKFLEHFGLKGLDDLADMEPMLASGPRFQKRPARQAELDLRSDGETVDKGPAAASGGAESEANS
jgi:segregation and condensation protein B